MSNLNFKKIFSVLFLTGFLFFLFGGFILAGTELELDYPDVEGAETPTTIKSGLPDFVKYIFNFAIIIAGLVTFASLIYGGFRYVTSAGNPVAMSDARSQITAGILGLFLILGSYLLLTTINPQLVILKLEPYEARKGVILYAGACQGDNPTGEEGVNFLRVRRSLSDLEDFSGKTNNIYFYNSGDEMEVEIYPDKGWRPEGAPSFKSYNHAADSCKPVGGGSKSIKIRWKIPGVYLFAQTNWGQPPDPHLYIADSADFGDFHDDARSLKILPWREKRLIWNESVVCNPMIYPGLCDEKPECCSEEIRIVAKFGAILHEKSNFEGDCQVFFENMADLGPKEEVNCPQTTEGSFCVKTVGDRASSIHLFKQNSPGIEGFGISGDGVTLYADYDWNEEEGGEEKDDCAGGDCKCGPLDPLAPTIVSAFGFVPGSESDPAGSDCKHVLGNTGKFKGSSIKVNGSFIALLFRTDGRCEVFKPPGDYRLDGNHIGNDEAFALMVIPVSRE